MLLALYVHIHTAVLDATDRVRLGRDERGQATAEYALVLLGAAAIAGLVAAWAMKSGKVGKLLDTVLDSLLGDAKKTS